MNRFYGPQHRQFQDESGTRPLADRLAALAHVELTPDERGFIESRTMFFLSTVDHLGRPTVSYKGGAAGFVRVAPDSSLLFPSYDGNGMYLSLGNIAATAEIGMLFIDFEEPHRLRLQGTAEILREPSLLAAAPGAQYVVRVRPHDIFVNCGRYIHQPGTVSPHIPDEQGHQPFPAWKRIELFGDVLTDADRRRVAGAGGPIPLEDYRGEHHVDRPEGAG